MAKIHKATVKETNETINVYLLSNGNYYDYNNMAEHLPPSAVKAGKKEFKTSELILNR